MNRREFILRKTPFVFLKRVAYITFFFALLPLAAVLWIDFRTEYAASPLATAVPSFTLFVLLVVGLLQFLIILISFATWYFPTYAVNDVEVIYRPGLISPDKRLAETSWITAVDLRQGVLARRFDYGSLVLDVAGGSATIKDIPSPGEIAQSLLSLAALESGTTTLQRLPARALIAQGENNQVEFKASLLWDYRREAVNKDLYEPVMKNVAAFMNTAGGALLIGVSDDGQSLGIESDYAGLPKKNVDGWENAFNMAFNQMIGAEMHHNVALAFEEIDGVTVCVVLVQPSSDSLLPQLQGQGGVLHPHREFQPAVAGQQGDALHANPLPSLTIRRSRHFQQNCQKAAVCGIMHTTSLGGMSPTAYDLDFHAAEQSSYHHTFRKGVLQ